LQGIGKHNQDSHPHKFQDIEIEEHHHCNSDCEHDHKESKLEISPIHRNCKSEKDTRSMSSVSHHSHNINIKAAVVHVIGDIIQSIGVIIASVIIYLYPEAKVADPICTFLFSILVVFTTVPVFKECVRILMQQAPPDIQTTKVLNALQNLQGVQKVEDLHVWSLAGGKNMMSAHLTLKDSHKDKTREVHHKAIHSLEEFEFCHVTLQIL
jgi:zinc transporter 2